jgi:hypothetical protein
MSITDYSDLEQEIKNAPEPKVLAAGTEVQFRIIKVNTGISDKNDCKWYSVGFDVPDEPLAKEFNGFFWELDKEHLDKKEYAKNLRNFRDFTTCIELDLSRPFDWEDDLVGMTGWAILGIKKSDEYGDQNTIKKYMTKK